MPGSPKSAPDAPSNRQAASVLCRAIARGDVKALEHAIGQHPSGVGHWKPIMDAAFAGRAAMARVLLAAGADANIVAGIAARHTPLTRLTQHHATIPKHAGHAETLKVLLNAGADVDRPAGPHHMAPLAYAAMGPAQALLDVLRPRQGRIDIHLAAALLEEDGLRRWLKTPQRSGAQDARGRTPLHYVALSGLWKTLGAEHPRRCAELLLDAGAAVDAAEEIPEGDEVFHATPLWRALAWQGNRGLAELLLERGADPNAAVFAVTYGGDEQACTLLARYQPNWDLRFGGRTPLMDLMRFRRPAATAFLIAQGVDVNAVDGNGLTALHFAAMRGVRADHMQRLLDAGARPDARDATGKTPLDYAKGRAQRAVLSGL